MLIDEKRGVDADVHANAFLIDEQHRVLAAETNFFSNELVYGNGARPLGPGVLHGTRMLSLEPATVTDRGIRLLFQQGETAFGKPIVDGQHPHDSLHGK